MQPLISILEYWIQFAGGWGVFAASLVEELISLIPSSVVQLGAGVFLMTGLPFSGGSFVKLIFEVTLPAALGVTIGSLPYVWLARKFGIFFIEKYGKWVGVSMKHIHNLEKKMRGSIWDDVVFVLLRAFPLVPAVALAVYAGIIEMSWKKYAMLTFFGVAIRATFLGITGWLFRDQFEKWSQDFGWLITSIGVVVTAVIIFFFWRLFQQQKNVREDN